MDIYDWSRFEKRISIKAPVQLIYDAWTTPEGLEKWFLKKAIFTNQESAVIASNEHIKKGDVYEWRWFGYSDELVERGTILEVNGLNYMQFVFGKAGNVSIQIKEEQSEVIIELIQENIPIDEESKSNYHVGCSTGWVFYLANLKSILEGGIDLRNKNIHLTNMINS